jgi:hypothetical protein
MSKFPARLWPSLCIAAAAAALAAPASAQPAAPVDPFEEEGVPYGVDPRDDRAAAIARAIPRAGQIEAMAPALDRMIGALLNVEVGPILDAADPYRRGYGYGRPGRTLGALAERDDPWFEERLRGSIYGVTSGMGRMAEGVAAAAPALARSLSEMERAIAIAVDDYHRRRGGPPERWDD